MSRALAAALAAAALACGGPLGPLPGGALRGEASPAPADDWAFARRFQALDLETRPSDPYSVRVGFTVRAGSLYIDPAKGRLWLPYLALEPDVRVRLGERIYPVRAVLVDDPLELVGFGPDRTVFRLDPR